jgi:hypothetical protein
MAKLSQYLEQTEDTLVAKKDCTVSISLSDYRMNDNIEIRDKEGTVWVNSLLSQVEFDNLIFSLILDYPVELQIKDMEYIEKEKIILKYKSQDIILSVPFTTVEIKERVNYVQRVIGGKEVYKSPDHLLKRILDVYTAVGTDMDLVHFEVLISQVIRDRTQEELPARLGKKWDPVMMNIKTIVFNSSFIQGLEFENVRKAIDTGLTSAQDLEPSVLEKLATGELVERRKR